MKRHITFRIWLSVFFGGISQFIRNIFSIKNKTPFWRIVWAVITICVVAFTSMMAYAFYQEFMKDKFLRSQYDARISRQYRYHNNGVNAGSSYIYMIAVPRKRFTKESTGLLYLRMATV